MAWAIPGRRLRPLPSPVCSPLKAIAWEIPVLFFMMWLFRFPDRDRDPRRVVVALRTGLDPLPVPLSRFAVRTVRPTWADGWGIHGTEFGTLYNVRIRGRGPELRGAAGSPWERMNRINC